MMFINVATVIAGTFIFACLLGMASYELGRVTAIRDERRKWLSFLCESCAFKDARLFQYEQEEKPLPFWVRWLIRSRER